MKDLTKGNIYKTFMFFAIPLVLTGFLTMAYNIVDTVIAGKFLGDEGLAATGATSAFINLISSVVWGFSSGVGMYIAKLFGEKNYVQIKSGLYLNGSIFIFLCLTISALAIIFRSNIYDFLKIDKEIVKEAGTYFSVYMLGFVFVVMNNFGAFLLNALGISTYPFILSIISAIMNIVLNIVSIVVFNLGVAGLAISTVLSAFVVDVFYVLKIKKCLKEMKVNKCKIVFSKESFSNSLTYSIPVTMQQVIMYASQMIISTFINAIGPAATAGYTVVDRIYSLHSNVYGNSAKTLSNYVAQSIGAKKPKNLKKGLKVGFIQNIAFILPMLLICVLFAPQVCSLFFPSGHSGESLAYAIGFSKYFLPFIVFNVVNNLFHAFYRGIASMKWLILSTLIGSAANIIASTVLIDNYGMYGMFAGWVISWIFEAIFTVTVYISGKWKTKEIKKMMESEN